MTEFIKNVSMDLVARTLTFPMGIITSIIIARVLGPIGKGIYSLVFLIPALLYIFSDFGITTANTYFVGNKKFESSDAASNSLLFGFVNGVLIVVLFLLLYKIVLHIFFQGVNPTFIYLVVLTLPFSLISNYFSGILLAKFKIKELSFLWIFSSFCTMSGVVFLLIFFNKGIFSLILLSLLISITVCFAYTFYVNRLTPIKFTFNTILFKKSLKFGIQAHLANVSSFLNYRLDMLLVNFFVGVTQVGYYSIAVGIAELMWFIPNSIQKILFAEVASSDNDSRRAEEMTAVLCRNTLFITFVLCVGLGIMGKEIIEILYGSVFSPSVMPLLVLLPGVLLLTISHVLGAYIIGVGRPDINLYGSSITLAINIVLNLLFIPKFGIVGAAFATTISYSAVTIYIIYMFRKLSNITLIDTLIIKPSDIKFYLSHFS